MKQKDLVIIVFILVSSIIVFAFSSGSEQQETLDARVKIALREGANQLLLSSNDSTSLILPIKKIGANRYTISFENSLTFKPDVLVKSLDAVIQQSNLSTHYRVQVLQCSDKEVAYSYEISNEKEKTIIPCAGRLLPLSCYNIDVKFDPIASRTFSFKWGLLLLILGGGIAYGILRFRESKTTTDTGSLQTKQTAIASFTFYPSEHKLIKASNVITLSRKECELLQILASNRNQVVKRETLTKQVWEDNGVVVGRSLDTYISKLRKKLADDSRISLKNVHGVGYSLSIDS